MAKVKTEKSSKQESNIKYVNRNTFKVMSDAFKTLNGKWGEMISATLLYICSVVALCFFPVFGFVLSFFATGFLSLGYISFTISLINNKRPKLETLFSNIKVALSAFALRLTMCAFVFLWGLLLIVPGIIVALNYSFAMSIMAQNPGMGTFTALKKSKEMVYGYRDVVFSIYLIMFFMMLMVFAAALVVPIVVGLFVPMPLWISFVIAGVILLVVHCTIIMPFLQTALTSIYLEARSNKRFAKESIKTTSPKSQTT